MNRPAPLSTSRPPRLPAPGAMLSLAKACTHPSRACASLPLSLDGRGYPARYGPGREGAGEGASSPRPSRAQAPRALPLLASLLVLLAAAGWGKDAHVTVASEAWKLLPPPLSTFALDRRVAIERQLMAPDERVADLRAARDRIKDELAKSPDSTDLALRLREAEQVYRTARARHFFDIDDLTDEPPPFASFPRDRKAVESIAAERLLKTDRAAAADLLGLAPDKLPSVGAAREPPASDPAGLSRLGAAALDQKYGTLPWVIADQVERLAAVFRKGDRDALPAALAELAHFVADLHQTLHATGNYDGQKTGNVGVHRTIDCNLITRRRDYYRDLPAAYLKPYGAIKEVPGAVFEQIGEDLRLLPRLFAADSEARRKSGATLEDFQWMKGLSDAEDDALFATAEPSKLDLRGRRLLRHADELHDLLREREGDLVRRRLADAASMLADLVYTAWLQADRPALAEPPSAPPRREPINWFSYLPWILAAVLLVVLLTRRRRSPPAEDDDLQ